VRARAARSVPAGATAHRIGTDEEAGGGRWSHSAGSAQRSSGQRRSGVGDGGPAADLRLTRQGGLGSGAGHHQEGKPASGSRSVIDPFGEFVSCEVRAAFCEPACSALAGRRARGRQSGVATPGTRAMLAKCERRIAEWPNE
jgi:hypothetical protein